MKTLHRLLPLLIALPALCGLVACNNSAESGNENKEVARLKEQLKQELSQLDTDSLESRTIWVTPEVNYVEEPGFLNEDSWPFIVGMLGIVAGCAVPVCITIVIARSIITRRKIDNRLIERAIEKNYPLPDEFFSGRTIYRSLYRGVIWVGVGTAFLLWFICSSGHKPAFMFLGIIPIFIGLANLAIYVARRRDSARTQIKDFTDYTQTPTDNTDCGDAQ